MISIKSGSRHAIMSVRLVSRIHARDFRLAATPAVQRALALHARIELVVIDVRPAAEYAAGHIAGARSIPFDRLAASIKHLPDELEVVAYCRGPYCVFADDAVRLLRRRGRRARRLEEGYPEWQRAKLPVEVG